MTAKHVFDLVNNGCLAEVHFPNLSNRLLGTKFIAIPRLIAYSEPDNLDYAVLEIKPQTYNAPKLEPLLMDLPEPDEERFDWSMDRALYVLGWSQKELNCIPEMSPLPCPYPAKLAKNLSLMLRERDGQALSSIYAKISHVCRNNELIQCINYYTTISDTRNDHPEDEKTISLFKDIVNYARKQFSDDLQARSKIAKQLIMLLNPKRFIIDNGGPTWGHSGALIIDPSSTCAPVGMFLCGYPDPAGEKNFMAKQFKVLQGLKLSAIDWNSIENDQTDE